MYYKPEDVDKLLDTVAIQDVVGEFVDLKKSGSSYKGLCPFHADTNPSFSVNPEKRVCKCFVCNNGGNAISFYSKYKKIPFYEAVKELARKYKVNIKPQKDNSNVDEYEKFYEIMEETHRFFMENIFKNEARGALNYLSSRDIDTNLIKEHQLGYASAKWSDLYDYLTLKGYTEKDLLVLGLIKKSDNGNIYDAFRNRVIFPIFSNHGRVIAFGGRTLENNKEIPKYINSPDTPIFKKGKNLYGLERAPIIKNKDYCILMEGYMDVLSGVLYDFDTSIAPLGTALTVEQASLLKRYTANVFLSFDMDKAGVSATERAGLILKEQGFNIRVLQFEGSKDPDEFLKKNGKDAFLEVVKNSIEIFDFLYKIYSSEYDLENPLAKQHFIERFSTFFSVVANPIERETYLKNLSSKTGISFESLFDQLVKNNKENTKHYFQEEIKKEKRKEKQEERFSSQDRESQNLEIAISKLLLLKPKYYKFFDEKMSNGFILKKVFEFFSKKIKEDNDLGSNNIIKDFNIFIEEDNDLTLSEKEDILGILNIKCSMENDRDIEDEKNNIETMKSYFRNRRDQEIEKGDLSLQRKHNWNLFFDEINFVFVEENRRVGKKNVKKVRTNMSFDELVVIFEKYKYLFQEN